MASNNVSVEMHGAWGSVAVYTLAGLLGVFIVVASIGNLMVLISIVATRKHCDRGYIFLFNLATVDFLTAVCVMPISMMTLLRGDFVFSEEVCNLNGFSVQLFFIASIHTLMYMSVYRYMSLSSPFTPIHLGKIAAMIAASWLFSLGISGLSTGPLSRFLYKPYTTQCGPGYPEDSLGWLNVLIIGIACFILPLAIILCMYVLLFRKARRLFRRLEDPNYSNYSHAAHKEQTYLTFTFIIIVVGFIICWTPIFTYFNYASLVKDKSTIPTLLNPIVYWFSYLNSAINPFIYGLRTPIFQKLGGAVCKTNSCSTESAQDSSQGASTPSLNKRSVVPKTKTLSADINGVSVQIEYSIKPETSLSHQIYIHSSL